VAAGADLLCIDSSDGFSVWQERTLKFITGRYPQAHCGAGNVVDGRGFRFLADAGASFVKVGIGGGSICTTRAQKGIGRGQATALIDVVRERDAYARQTGWYVPVCCDGGVSTEREMSVALALGADFIMLGRVFAGCPASPVGRCPPWPCPSRTGRLRPAGRATGRPSLHGTGVSVAGGWT
jgi:IMP dehydrogenase